VALIDEVFDRVAPGLAAATGEEDAHGVDGSEQIEPAATIR
jgi:hypothetical protein